ncbi:hypothetical protein [Geminocystis herdmanii]|uniref:hypothetical protein n=1 Tax=Geminocystis herdmanii TaxID=669359 RepID=UPI00034D0C1F|nr:hypothetical protein [Geminocystis herdmanii]
MLNINTIEFTTKINQGMILIPQEYNGKLTEELEVEVIIKPIKKRRLMDELAENPVIVDNWKDLTREDINDR